ncbi:MAG: hypothetical protein ACRDKB_03130 [Actinomycetota bacterium]
MAQQVIRRRTPFWVAAAVLLVVSLGVLRLPESFVAQIERNRPLSSSQAGWAYRLIAVAAVAQAAYGGFIFLRPEAIRRAREKDQKVAAMPRERVASLVARNAAFMVVLTLVYGLAALAITGERGGFWLFAVIAAAQGAWYYRQVGEIGQWLSFQPAVEALGRRGEWRREPPDYCPPVARGLRPLQR